MKKLIEKAAKTHFLSKTDLIKILKDNSVNKFLYLTADKVRQKYKGNSVHLRALTEFSNICTQNCKYCGLRRDNKNIDRYCLSVEQIVKTAKKAIDKGLKTIVLQSGESACLSTELLCSAIKQIKSLNAAVTLSIGEKTFEEYKAYKEAGADRYLLRIETTDEKLYSLLHPGMDINNRKICLKNLKNLGYEVGTGCLVGLPAQTDDSLADDILFIKNLNADMAGIGPFIPNPDTPLANESGGSFDKALKVIALIRLLLPDINIPATSAIEVLRHDGRIITLQSGANVVMPNMTDKSEADKYLLYPGKTGINKESEDNLSELKSKINSIGRTVSQTFGFRTDV